HPLTTFGQALILVSDQSVPGDRTRGIKTDAVSAHLFISAQRRELVEDPDPATVGRDHEIVVDHLDVVYRYGRQVPAARSPGGALVVRRVDAGLGPAIEEPGLRGVGADHAAELVAWNAGVDTLPRRAEIARAEEIRSEVV